MKPPLELEPLTALVPKDALADLKSLAAANERSLAAEVRRAIRAHLDAEAKEAAA